MIKALLFDMDGTLLDIRFNTFITLYGADMSRLLGEIARKNPLSLGVPAARSYLAMSDAKREDNLLNIEKFAQTYLQLTGIPLLEPTIREALCYFEREVLPHKNSATTFNAHPMEGSRELLELTRSLGLKTALATNPAFSKLCIEARMGWSEIGYDDFDFVTHAENSYRLKPYRAYYDFVAEQLGVAPEECLMVGNDSARDIVRPANGMKTAFVGKTGGREAIWRGSIKGLVAELEPLILRLNATQG